ncbi:MAG TPA: toll/interleukin-1 receptor domain-containing protein [Verrucomicrobiae bacterium]|nr:toll/interleukin-1 receptor domain-containing protein [Verrucomicrobiae bacterium]
MTAAGYRVWCDRFQLLGGESYPKDIDTAIKAKTFRMLALLSRHSIDRENPRKERTLALNIARERGIDFLIPLNVDGRRPTELDWMTGDLTFIPFHPSWATGLQQLLTKLDKLNTPRTLENGASIAAETFLPKDFLLSTPEPLSSNCLRFQKIPPVVKRLKFRREPTKEEKDALTLHWACYWESDVTVLTFHDPPEPGKKIGFAVAGGAAWMNVSEIDDIPSRNIVSSLLFKSLRVKCLSRGLQLTLDNRLYFPRGLLENDKIHFVSYGGEKTWVLVAGTRSAYAPGKPPSKYCYHLSPEVGVVQNLMDPFIAQFRMRLHLTDANGQPLPHRSAVARRKKIARFWWNHQWFNRLLAFHHFLANGTDTIVIGENPNEQVILDAHPLCFQANVSINERALGHPIEELKGPEASPANVAPDSDEDEITDD